MPKLPAGTRASFEKLEDRTLLSVSTDGLGFTVVTPSADTRMIHVAAGGSDSNDGLSPATALATISQARTLVRSGFPDWILLRRGDSFTGQRFNSWTTSGRSASEPFVIGAYTDPNAPSTARPKLNTGINTGFSFSSSSPASHVYIMGLEFEAHRRDYREAPANFTTSWLTDQQGASYGINGTGPISDIVVEDSFFRYYKMGLVFQNNASDIRIRRNVIADSWAVNTDAFGNAMGFDTAANGIYADTVNGLTIDGNVLSHNGWADSNALGARQNIYSHNLYLNTGNSNVSVTNNIIADAASHGLQMRAGGLVKGNLFLRNPIAMSYGLVNGAVKVGGVSGEVSDNVVVGSAAIFNSPRGYGIEIANLKAISQGGGTVIRNNVFANDNQNSNPAIKLDQPSTSVPDVGINDLLIEQNIVYSWWKGINIHSSYEVSRPLTGLIVRQNDFQRINSSTTIADINGPFDASHQSWSNNRYDSLNNTTTSNLFKINGVNKTLAQWQAQVEPTAVLARGLFPDPGRTAGGFNATVGGVNSTDAFIEQALRQSKAFWRTNYTAGPAAEWIRAGYAGGRIDVAAPTASASAANIAIAGDSTHTFTVTYADDNQLNLASLGDGDVRVTGPNGYSAAATLVSSIGPADARQRTATYRIAAPAGKWSAAANGLYTIATDPGQVLDASGKSASTDPIGTFSVTIDPGVPAAVALGTAVVTNTAAATVSVTYSGATSPALPTSVSPIGAGFETPNVAGEPGGFLYQPADAGWTFDPSAGISADNSGFTSGNSPAPQGGQVAFVQSFGSMSQVIDNWQAGTYTVAFQAAQRANVGSPVHDFQVLVDGQVVGTFTPIDTTYQPYATAQFTVAAGAHTVEFRGLNTAGGDNTSFIDDVQIAGTTTPTTQQFASTIFDAADIQLTGSNGYTTTPTSAVVDDPADGNPRTVTYTVPAPAGGWSSLGLATLAVRVVAGQVVTTGGVAVPAGKIGTLNLSVELPFVSAVNAADVTASSIANQTFNVTYVDNEPGAALPASIDSGDLKVSGPGGYNQPAILVSHGGAGTTASPLVATYTVAAPPGGWTSVVNGTYWINAQPNQVIDADGNALPAGAIGSFAVAVDAAPPIAWASEDDITTPTTAAKVIDVSYYDISGILTSSMDGGDIRVVGPNGYDVATTFVSRVNGTTTGSAVYSLPARGGKWQSAHNGVYSIVLQPNQVLDNRGNVAASPTTIATFNVALETTPPVATISTPVPSLRNSAVASIGFNFSEAVTGVDLADLSLSRDGVGVSLTGATLTTTDNISFTLGNLSSVNAVSGVYLLTVKAAGSGILDAAGNAMVANATTTWTMDLIKPTATATAGDVVTTSTLPLTLAVKYVDNVDLNATTLDGLDVRVTGPGGFNVAASLESVTGSGGTRTATYSLASPAGGWKSSHNGAYSIVLQANQVLDTAGNAANSATIGTFNIALETTPPTVAIAAVTPNPRGSTVASLAIAFSEPVNGFDLADLSLTRNGSALSLTGATLSTTDGINFSLTNVGDLTGATGSYALSLAAANSGISDLSGNALVAGSVATWTMDATPPQAVAGAPGVTTPSTGSLLISVVYSDNLDINAATLDHSDILVTGPNEFSAPAAFVSVSGSAGSRTAVYSLAAPVGGWKSSHNGSYSIVLQSGQVADIVGNAAVGGTIGSFTVALETTPPTVNIAAVSTPRQQPVDSIAVQFSESVTGFDLSDLSLVRDGQAVALAGVTLEGSGASYLLGGLSEATAAAGTYTLTLAAPAGIADAAGNLLAAGASVTFAVQFDIVAPAVTGVGPASLSGSVFRQQLVIIGTDFSGDASVTLRSQATGQPLADVAVLSRTATQIVVSARLGELGGMFSAEVAGSNGSSTPYAFDVAAQAAVTTAGSVDTGGVVANLAVNGVAGLGVTYAWSMTSGPAAVSFSSETSAVTTASFARAGTYGFQVVASDGTASLARTVELVVAQQAGSWVITPATATVAAGAQQQFTASARDQFGQAMVTAPTVGWNLLSGVGSIDAAGRYTAPATGGGSAVVQASGGGVFGTAAITALPPASTSLAKIDFAPASAALAAGYVGDSGLVYAGRGNGLTYGWTTSHTDSVYRRNVNADPLFDTTLAVKIGQRWEMAVANGTYTVTVGVGDAAATTSNNIWIEGVRLFNYTSLAANSFAVRTMTVTVADGKLTLGIGSAADLVTRMTHLEVTAGTTSPPASPPPTSPPPTSPPPTTGTAIKVNFQPSTAPAVIGYSIDGGSVYGGRGNGQTFGWTSSHTDSVYDRNKSSNQLIDTTLAIKSGAKWELAVPNGTYTVTVGVGDAASTTTNNLWIEGIQLFNYEKLNANAFSTRSKTVTVSDGRLTLGTGSAATGTTRVNYIEVTPAASATAGASTATSGVVSPPTSLSSSNEVATAPVQVNFQPTSTTGVNGFLIDAGAIYASRSNGQSYGWSIDQTATVFARQLVGDPLLDTSVAVRQGARWELAVASGTYVVNIGVGDAKTASVNNVWVEGQQLFNYVPLAANTFATRAITVAVTDGKLTLGTGSATDLATFLTHVVVTRAS